MLGNGFIFLVSVDSIEFEEAPKPFALEEYIPAWAPKPVIVNLPVVSEATVTPLAPIICVLEPVDAPPWTIFK